MSTMSEFQRLNQQWRQAQAVAEATKTPAALAEAERLRQAVISCKAVQDAWRQTDARPVR